MLNMLQNQLERPPFITGQLQRGRAPPVLDNADLRDEVGGGQVSDSSSAEEYMEDEEDDEGGSKG
jgi:hypothetical protein